MFRWIDSLSQKPLYQRRRIFIWSLVILVPIVVIGGGWLMMLSIQNSPGHPVASDTSASSSLDMLLQETGQTISGVSGLVNVFRGSTSSSSTTTPSVSQLPASGSPTSSTPFNY